MKGGKRMSFRATVVVGDGRGRVGFASAKGRDVSLAITKAQARARRRLLYVPLKRGTIPHEVRCKFKAVTVLLKPAKVGQGIIAGGVVRTIAKLLGAQNIVSKVIRGSNKITIANATLSALAQIHGAQRVAAVEAPTVSAYTS
jgi:small subunit ribosomal protein S5